MVGARARCAVVLAAVALTAGCGASVTMAGPNTTVTTGSGQTPGQIAAQRLAGQLLPASAEPGYAYGERWSSAHLPGDLSQPPTVTGSAACVTFYKSFLRATAGEATASAYAAETITDRKSYDSVNEWVGTFDDATARQVMTRIAAEAEGCHGMTLTLDDGTKVPMTLQMMFPDETPAFGQSTVAATLTAKGVNLVEVVGRFGDEIGSYSVSESALPDAEVTARELGPVAAGRIHG